jgi:hypothetical protein
LDANILDRRSLKAMMTTKRELDVALHEIIATTAETPLDQSQIYRLAAVRRAGNVMTCRRKDLRHLGITDSSVSELGVQYNEMST